MADRYWVGGSGTWDSSNTTNWSTFSNGPGGASVPTTSDRVFIDGASGTSGDTLSLAANRSCSSFTYGVGGTAATIQLVSGGGTQLSCWQAGFIVNLHGTLDLSWLSLQLYGVAPALKSDVPLGDVTVQTNSTVTLAGNFSCARFESAVFLRTTDLNGYVLTCTSIRAVYRFTDGTVVVNPQASGTAADFSGCDSSTSNLLIEINNSAYGVTYLPPPTLPGGTGIPPSLTLRTSQPCAIGSGTVNDLRCEGIGVSFTTASDATGLGVYGSLIVVDDAAHVAGNITIRDRNVGLSSSRTLNFGANSTFAGVFATEFINDYFYFSGSVSFNNLTLDGFIYLQASQITVRGTLDTSDVVVLEAATSEVSFEPAGSTAYLITPTAATPDAFYGVRISVPKTLSITGGLTCANLTCENLLGAGGSATILLADGTTNTVAGNITLSGASESDRVALGVVGGASAATISKLAGEVVAENATIDYSIATGGANFIASTSLGNIDGGNNTGWDFTATAASAGLFLFF
jgi:hypothetical protein